MSFFKAQCQFCHAKTFARPTCYQCEVDQTILDVMIVDPGVEDAFPSITVYARVSEALGRRVFILPSRMMIVRRLRELEREGFVRQLRRTNEQGEPLAGHAASVWIPAP